MPKDLKKLKETINSDPRLAGLDHEAIAKLLTVTDRQIDATHIDQGAIAAAIVGSEYVTLKADAKSLLAVYASAGRMPLTTTLKAELTAMFPQGSQTRTNLLEAMRTQGSKADEIGFVPTTSDVADALLRTN